MASSSMGFIPSVLSLISLILSFVANVGCNLVKPNILEWFDWLTQAPDSIGLWCAQDNAGQTFSLQDEQGDDSSYQAARGLGTTVLVFGTLFMIIYIVAAVGRLNGKSFFVLGMFCILTCCLFQGLVFLIFKSDFCSFGCSLDTGGKIGIAACVGWFFTGIASMLVGMQDIE